VAVTEGLCMRSFVMICDTYVLLYSCMKKRSWEAVFFCLGWSRAVMWSLLGV
jgi:hypothetical protein